MYQSKLVSIESPYNSIYPWYQIRNIQYAIQANTHASSLGDVTWTPHIANTQFVKYGINSYISDTLSGFILKHLQNKQKTYLIGREQTLINTNHIRSTKIDKVICYTDYGISSGMQSAIDTATKHNVPIEYRKLPSDLKQDIFGESFASTATPIIKSVFIPILSLQTFHHYLMMIYVMIFVKS